MAQTVKNINHKLRIVKPATPKPETPATQALLTTRVTALEDGLNLNRQDGGLLKYVDISLLLVFQLDSDPSTWYLEVFVYGQPAPFRLSQKVINYRQFLPELSERSKDNFWTFLFYLINRTDSVYVDENTFEFLKSKKIIGYPDFTLFEQYTRQLWFQLITWMTFRCEHCGEVYWVDEAKVAAQGAKTKCVKCQQIITVKKRTRPVPLQQKERQKTVSCPHCQYENQEGTRFCVMCQKPLVSFAPKSEPQTQPPIQFAQEKELSASDRDSAASRDLSDVPLQARERKTPYLSLREIAMSLQDDINTLEHKFAWFAQFSGVMQILGFVFLIGGLLFGVYIYFAMPNPGLLGILTPEKRMTYAGLATGAGILLSLACIIASNIIALTLEIERNTKVTVLLLQKLISKQEQE